MSSVSRTRATNLTGLIDIDSLVEANLLRQKTKINTATQKLKVEQYKQEQYREIQTKAKKFYNKYFDVASGDSLFNAKTYNAMKAVSSNSDAVTATASTNASAGSYKVTVNNAAKAASQSIGEEDLMSLKGKTIIIKDKEFTLKSDATNGKEIAEDLNSQLKSAGINVTATFTDLYGTKGGMVIKSNVAGTAGDFSISYKQPDEIENIVGFNGFSGNTGSNASVTIEDLATGASREYTDISNEIEVDGIKFKIDENAVAGSESKITVKADGTELKDKIVEFIDDYNELLGSINGKLYEEYDRSYLPLTDEDKEGLSDSEIEKLEKKAQTGLLRNDSYLSDFADDMKMTMASVMKKEWGGSSVGLSLEKIGIKPIEDYTSQNGLFTVDEDTLLEAIESNIDGVKELFTRGMSNASSSESDGVFVKLKNNLYEHATGTFSRLANRAGIANGVTANTNEMTKDIEQRKKMITQMQTALQEKEDALYTKYSTLESNLASLQSQQNSLSSYFQ